jgi:hypothetical protein
MLRNANQIVVRGTFLKRLSGHRWSLTPRALGKSTRIPRSDAGYSGGGWATREERRFEFAEIQAGSAPRAAQRAVRGEQALELAQELKLADRGAAHCSPLRQ